MWHLNDLGLKYGTDKASNWHRYLDFYEEVLKDIDVKSLLEIGIYQWASIRMWREFFPNAKIIGVDIRECPAIHWCELIRADATTKSFADSVGMFDVILDDWWHFMSQQIHSFDNLRSHVAPDGVYILEDACTSFRPHFLDMGNVTAYDYLIEFATKHNIKYSEFRKQEGNKSGAWTLILLKNE